MEQRDAMVANVLYVTGDNQMTREHGKYMKNAHGRCGRALVIAILFMVACSAAAFAQGGDPVAPFPLVDARAGLQYAKAMAVDSGGNVIVAGYMNNGTNNDYMLAKFKADGSGLAWDPVYYNGTGDDAATAVAVDASGNIILTGTSWNGINNDIRTIKYNGATGAVLWGHTYNSGGNDTATSLAIDSSGDIYVAGYAANGTAKDDFLVIKYPSAGSTPAWVELSDDSAYPQNDNRILSITAGINGIAVTGYSSKGGADFDILTRAYGFDKTLVREWRYASPGSGDDRGIAVRMDSIGMVIVTGYATNAAGNTDIYTGRYNPANAAPVWEKMYDGGGYDEARGVWVDTDGDVYVTGLTTTLAGNEDFFTARYRAADGTLIWKSVFDDGNGSTDIPVAVVVDGAADGGVFVAGYTNVSSNEDYMTLKYRKDNGSLLWEKLWNGSSNKNDRPIGIALEPATAPHPRNVILAGWSDDSSTMYDFVTLKYDFGALNAPGGLSATAASNTSITLGWSDNSSNEETFYIQRKLGEGGTFADITTTPSPLASNTVVYTDTGLTPNNYYYYRVRAYNAANGDSYYSNEARALTKVVSYDSPAWTYIYNGADNLTDRATAITSGSDDHPVVTGYSDLTEEGVAGSYSFDYMTMKLDRANASIKWKARYDSGEGGTDQAEGVVLDNNGNVLVTGTAYLFGNSDKSDDLYTIKYNTATYSDPVNSPPVLWGDQYGTQSGVDQATAIEVAHDSSNNSVVIGYGNGSGTTDIFIIKYNADGSRAWTPVVYNSGRNDYPTGLALDSAGDIFVSGYSFDTNDTVEVPTGSYDWFTAKYSGATGVLIWSDTYNVSKLNFGGVNRNDQALSIDVDAAGNAYATGYATNSDGKTVYYTVKYDGKAVPVGARRIWEKSFNYPGFHADAVALKIDPIDGAAVVAGSASVSATDSDFHLIRYNALDGAVIWERNFDKPDSYDYVAAMNLDSSGYIYISGDTRSGADTDPAFDSSSDIMSLIYDFEGTFLGASRYNGSANNHDEAVAMTVNYQGEAFTAGSSTNASGNDDYVVVKQKNNYILVPAPLAAAAQADYTKIDLVWRDNSPGTTFRIERTAAPSNPLSVWELVASPASGTTAFTDTGRVAGNGYCYRIDAVSGSLNSRKIETCVSTTLSAPALSPLTVDSSTQITLNWSQVANNTGYKVERKTDTGSWSELATTAAGINTYVDSGLAAGTLYYYRVSAGNAGGFSTPAGQSASTRPSAPVQSAPAGLTSSQVMLAWSNVAGETGYRIERKEGAGGVYSQVGTTGSDVVTYTDSTLISNTQYYYRVVAQNASGDSEYSSEQAVLALFTTPTLSSAAGSSATQIDLAWPAVPGATGYSIQGSNCNYNGNDNDVSICTPFYFTNYFSSYFSAWTTIANVAADVLTYHHTPLSSGYSYIYRVIANTTGNSSAGSNPIIAWTHMTAPVLTITPASETSLTPSWNNINGASNYTLESKLGSGGTFGEVTGAIGLNTGTTSYTHTGLGLSTEYCYRVKAYSTLPNPPPAIYSNELCATTPLAAPVLNTPALVSTTRIDLSWNDVPGTTGYEIQKCNTTYPNNPEYLGSYGNNPSYASWFWSCSPVISLPPGSVNYSDVSVTAGYTYRYTIRDTYSGGVSAYSAPQDIIAIPVAPALSASAASTVQMNLSWNDVNGDAGYKLEWKPRTGGDCSAGTWDGPITIGENVTTYQHTGLAASTYYCYRIKAYNAYSESAFSTEIAQTTALEPPTLNIPAGVTASKVDLSWNNVTGNSGYLVERKTGVDGAWGQVGSVGQDVITYSDSGLAAGTLYYYRLKVTNAGGASLPGNEQSTTTAPSATAHTVTVASSSRLELAWPVVPGATAYKVERKTGVDAYAEITNVAADYGTSYCGYSYPTVSCASLTPAVAGYQDSGLTENTSYCYRIASWNSTGGASSYSAEQCATTSAMSVQSLTATAINSFKIRLDWTPVACTPNACDNPDGFEIERQVRSGIWVNLKTVDGATLSYIDTIALEPNKQYSYRVRTFKGTDKSPDSNISNVTTPLYSADLLTCP